MKIVADSGCDFTTEMKNNSNIVQVPLTLQINDEIFSDTLDLDIVNFRNKLRENKKNRKTAAPSPQLYVDAYGGDEDVFVVTLSSHLSGSYNSAVTAQDLYFDDYGKKNIFVVDSKSASVGETLIVNKLLELKEKGLSFDEIKEEICKFRDNLNTYFILENYDSLVNTGRLNPYVAKLAALLGIVPICGADDGHAVLTAKAKGMKKPYLKLIDDITKKCNDTKKAERFFKERRIPYQFIDLKEKSLSKGELQSVKKAIGLENLINKNSKDYKKLNMDKIRGAETREELLLKNPTLYVTPIVRNGKEATVGNSPEVWKSWE